MKKTKFMQEYELYDGEAFITFNVWEINEDKNEISVVVTNRGKITMVTYSPLNKQSASGSAELRTPTLKCFRILRRWQQNIWKTSKNFLIKLSPRLARGFAFVPTKAVLVRKRRRTFGAYKTSLPQRGKVAAEG